MISCLELDDVGVVLDGGYLLRLLHRLVVHAHLVQRLRPRESRRCGDGSGTCARYSL